MFLAYAPDRIAKDIGTDRQLCIDDVVAVAREPRNPPDEPGSVNLRHAPTSGREWEQVRTW